MTTVSPSPRDLWAKLSIEEKVAMDLILSGGSGEDLAVLVPDPPRRGYLRTLARQLQALGETLHDSTLLDQERAAWEAARQRSAEWQADRVRLQATAHARDQQRLQTLTPEARRAVERRRRRQQRRRGAL